MSIVYKSHGGQPPESADDRSVSPALAPPFGGHIAADAEADFGYFFPFSGAPQDYLSEDPQTEVDLDALGDAMVDANGSGPESDLAPILTYWGQFLDHELTLRTNGEGAFTKIEDGAPPLDAAKVEVQLKNARSPRFDLDSVYGGLPLGAGVTSDVATVISGMRHPKHRHKMRVGTAQGPSQLPDSLDEHRDVPRYVQASKAVRDAAIRIFDASEPNPDARQKFATGLPKRALIGDARNDENLIIAQFHLSFLRFHNRAVDFLERDDAGWIADFASAQTLTRLHYQWLIVEGYLKGVCDPEVVAAVVRNRASLFFQFRAEFDKRNAGGRMGNALPVEFAAAGFRFAHSMVRHSYDHNDSFGAEKKVLPDASLDLLFQFTGGFTPKPGQPGITPASNNRLPRNWVIDWARFTKADPVAKGQDPETPPRVAGKIDTRLAKALGNMVKEGLGLPDDVLANEPDKKALHGLLRQLARRNLRRGYNLRLPTGQALHAYLQAKGAVASAPIADLTTLGNLNDPMKKALLATRTGMATRTPLWLYILAEAEQGGGNKLGELGSWLVASTFIGVLLADPDSALSQGFHPDHSPLRMPDGSAIDTIEKWLKFALVLE